MITYNVLSKLISHQKLNLDLNLVQNNNSNSNKKMEIIALEVKRVQTNNSINLLVM